MSADADDLAARVANAIAGELPGEMVTRWVLAAETIGADGDRALWLLAPDDAKSWDTLGLAEYALAVERGRVTADAITDDGAT